MAAKDYYQILGVTKGASHDEIKAAFKTAAKKYHPDRNPDDKVAEEKFKEISEAYEVLGDEAKRKQYDQFGRFDFGGRGPQDPFQQGFWQQGGFNQVDIEDIFGDIFGFGGARRGRKAGKVKFDFGDLGGGGFTGFSGGPGGSSYSQAGRNGADLTWALPIDFLEAVQGCEKQILTSDGHKVKVKIPAGVDTGSKIRLAGKGNPGVAGGRPGDLIIETEVRAHPYFRREGDDIHVDVNVSVLEALQGATITVPTVQGDVSLKIPKGSQGGQKMRLKGKGVPNLKTKEIGNQYVHLNVVVPKDLTDEEINHLEKILGRHREAVRTW